MTVEKVLKNLEKHIKDTASNKEFHRRPKFKFTIEQQRVLYTPFGIVNLPQPVYHVSIQASSGHYSSPRVDGLSCYYEVELGFPNFKFSDDFISKYAEDVDEPKDTVYGYVPLHELAEELFKFGYRG